ncbi:hypothetical protein D3C75_756580 [compost metagenome]
MIFAQGVAGADIDLALAQTLHLPQRLLRHIHQTEGLIQIAEQHLAFRRQGHAPGCPVKQLAAQLGLQLLQGMADCRLGNVQPLGGSGQAARLGCPIKHPVPFQVDLQHYYLTLYKVL